MKNTIRTFWKKLLSFLRVRLTQCGLEISDQVLRIAHFDGSSWQTAAVRLEPGILENGKVKNEEAFAAALLALRSKLPVTRDHKKKISAAISLSSINIYSQVFSLPMIEGKDLEKAIELNVQMVSPMDVSQVYSGWQILGRDEASLRTEVIAAFAEKQAVDDVIRILFKVGFITTTVESRALALMRIFREQSDAFDAQKSYLLVDIDNSGIDFLIIRKGGLYFEYGTQWADVTDEKGQISIAKFDETISGSMRQVTNFYDQHWKDPLSSVIVSSGLLWDETQKALANASTLPVLPLVLAKTSSLSPEWFVALGCSIRNFASTGKDKEVNLLGEGAGDAFRREQIKHFLSLWRVLVPVAFALLLAVFITADAFLMQTNSALQSQSSLQLSKADNDEIQNLESSSTDFNNLVALVESVESMQNPKSPLIQYMLNLAASSSVELNNISFPGADAPMLVAGNASSEDEVVNFKNAVQADPHFGTVNLPLANIQENAGSFSFSMTFPVTSDVFH
jgi:hypothetical protein